MRPHDVRAIRCNLRGWAVGEDNPRARHADAVVEIARARRAAGERVIDIAADLGISARTVADWVAGRRRNTPAVRVVVRRVVDRVQDAAQATDDTEVPPGPGNRASGPPDAAVGHSVNDVEPRPGCPELSTHLSDDGASALTGAGSVPTASAATPPATQDPPRRSPR